MALLAAGTSALAEERRDTYRIEDQWLVVSFTYRGEAVERFHGNTVVFIDGLMTRRGKERMSRGMYRIRPARNPKQLDLIVKNEEKTCTARGIYKFEDNKLVICYAPFDQPRANKFESDEENGNVLVVLEPFAPDQE